MPDDLTLRSATELSALITRGEVSPVELTEAFIARAKRFERLNAYITLDEEGALRAARAAEAELGRGMARGPAPRAARRGEGSVRRQRDADDAGRETSWTTSRTRTPRLWDVCARTARCSSAS